MVSQKSKENLAKGRTKGIKRKKTNHSPDALTWQNLSNAILSLPIPDNVENAKRLDMLKTVIGITPEFLNGIGLEHPTWKIYKLGMMLLDNSPAANKELMERSEGKVKEQVELSGEIAVKGYANVSPDDWDDGNPPD